MSSFATGVGHNEDSLSDMRGTKRRSRNNLPLRIVPQPGKVGQDFWEARGAESSHILQEDPSGLSFANKTGNVGPEPAIIFQPFATARERRGLAGESGGDDVVLSGPNMEGLDVVMLRDIRPMLGKDALTERVDLDK